MRKLRFKIPKKYRLKLIFLVRLTVFGILFRIIWNLTPDFFLIKLITAHIVAFLTFSKVVVDPSGVFVVKNNFSLLIVTDCTAWKEAFVFLSLFISWPKEKDPVRAVISLIGIFLYNIARLSYLVVFNRSFDYFHPAFQLLSIFVILALWLWSISVKKARNRTYRRSSRKKSRRRK